MSNQTLELVSDTLRALRNRAPVRSTSDKYARFNKTPASDVLRVSRKNTQSSTPKPVNQNLRTPIQFQPRVSLTDPVNVGKTLQRRDMEFSSVCVNRGRDYQPGFSMLQQSVDLCVTGGAVVGKTAFVQDRVITPSLQATENTSLCISADVGQDIVICGPNTLYTGDVTSDGKVSAITVEADNGIFANLSLINLFADTISGYTNPNEIIITGIPFSQGVITANIVGSSTELQGYGISTSPPMSNQVLTWDDSQQLWTPNNAPGTDLSGDVSGDTGNATVIGLQDRPLSSAAPNPNDVLQWSGTEWAPATGATSSLPDSNIYVGNASNIATAVAMSNDATISNTGALTLANTTVTPGTYSNTNLTVDSKGRITAASNGAGSGLPSLSNGLLWIGNGSNVATATSVSGDATVASTGVLSLANTSVSPGSYGSSTQVPTFTVDAKGRITAAVNASISGLSSSALTATGVGATGYGSSTQVASFVVDSAGRLTSASNVSISGLSSAALTATGVGASSYGSTTQVATFSVDSAGRLTGASNATISGTSPGGAAGGDLAGTYPSPTLANTTVIASSYGTTSSHPSFTVDTKGRLTSASNTLITGLTSFALSPSGVSAGTYGSATQTGVFVVDTAGRLTSASNVSTSLSGIAGGDLTGTFPNPTIAPTAVTAGTYGTATQVGSFSVDSTGRLTLASNIPLSAAMGIAGGDLTGVYPNPTLATTAVTAGTYGSSTQTGVFTVDASGRLTLASNIPTSFGGAAGGDLTGTFPNPVVDALQTVPVDVAAPTLNQVLQYNGTMWQAGPTTTNSAIGSGVLPSITSGTNNAILGYQAGTSISSGSDNTCIGSLSTTSASGAVAVGKSTVVATDNSVVIGNGVNDSGTGPGNTTYTTGGLFMYHRGPVSAMVNMAGWISGTSELIEISSSRRFKDNIRDLEPVSDRFDLLRSVRYTPKEGHGGFPGDIREHIGFIAEEVQEIFPEIVTTDKDGLVTGMMYDRLVPVLIKEVQSLKAELRALKQH